MVQKHPTVAASRAILPLASGSRWVELYPVLGQHQ